MCMIDDADPCTWFGTDSHRARKPHKCAECGRAIAAGEVYFRSTYISDGKFEAVKACEHCHAARDWLTKHCGGWLTYGLRDELDEHWDEGYREDRLGRLIVGVRRDWQRFGGGLMPVPHIPINRIEAPTDGR
jgi:hypothetical protein